MKKSNFSDIEILAALQRVEEGLPAQALCWELGITMKTFNSWRSTHGQAALEALADRETTLLMSRLRKMEAEGVRRLKKIQMQENLKAKEPKDRSEKK